MAVRIDRFDKKDGKNLLGGDQAAFMHGAAVASAVTVEDAGDWFLRIAYGGAIGEVQAYASSVFSYAGWRSDLRGLDCSECGDIRFRIRGARGGEQPNLYLDDGNHRWGVDVEKYGEITTDWREIAIPLADIAEYGVDLTHLEALEVVFEWEKMSGAVFLDDIRFGARSAVASR